MATTLFVSGRIESRKDDGTVNSGGKVYFYDVATTTPKNSYPSKADASAGTNANANPLILDSAGRGIAYIVGDAKVTIHTSADVLIYTQDFVLPQVITTVIAVTTSTALDATKNNFIIQTSGSGLTHTLTSAATLGVGWVSEIRSTDNNTWILARANSADTINGALASITVPAGHSVRVFVNASGNGFFTDNNPSITGLNLFSSGIGPSYLQNIGFDVTGDGGAGTLTFSLLTKAGTTPTATNKVQIEHRDPTITTGRTITREATAATTLLVPNGATLGYIAAEINFLYMYSIWSAAGGLEVAVIKRAILNESELHNTTAISTAADSDNVLYSTTARTGATVRLVGRGKVQTGATAGVWDNQASEETVWTPNIIGTTAAAGYVRMNDELCTKLDITTGITNLTRDVITTITAPSFSATGMILSVNTSARSGNSILLRFASVEVYSDSGGTVGISSCSNAAYEHVAVAAGAQLSGNITQLVVTGNTVYIKLLDDVGNQGTGTVTVVGYFEK